MGKVVILEQLGDAMDMTSLSKFGEVEIMFHRNNKSPSVFHTDEFLARVQDWFESHFDPTQDLFVVAGRMTKVSLAMVALTHVFAERYATSVLIYDGSEHAYVERKI